MSLKTTIQEWIHNQQQNYEERNEILSLNIGNEIVSEPIKNLAILHLVDRKTEIPKFHLVKMKTDINYSFYMGDLGGPSYMMTFQDIFNKNTLVNTDAYRQCGIYYVTILFPMDHIQKNKYTLSRADFELEFAKLEGNSEYGGHRPKRLSQR